MFSEPLIATSDDTFAWTSPADVRFVRGDLLSVTGYAVDDSGDLVGATSLIDATVPASGTGFYYLVRLAGSCAVGSWQSVIGAEAGRDQVLP